MLRVPQEAEVLLNGVLVEVKATYAMGERFGTVSAIVVMSGARWMARLGR